MITGVKLLIFCIADFLQEFEIEVAKNALPSSADASEAAPEKRKFRCEGITIPGMIAKLSDVAYSLKHLFRRHSPNNALNHMFSEECTRETSRLYTTSAQQLYRRMGW